MNIFLIPNPRKQKQGKLNRERILEILKDEAENSSGGKTIEDLAPLIGLSLTQVQRHLITLSIEGRVRREGDYYFWQHNPNFQEVSYFSSRYMINKISNYEIEIEVTKVRDKYKISDRSFS
jgi:DNA-binding Lrp family transcriptional regulator